MTRSLTAPIVSAGEAAELARRWQAGGRMVVFTNGHFDLLHIGHLHYLQSARSEGDCLIVGLNSDASTRLRKGPDRPIIPQEERAVLLAALRCVDAVVLFDTADCVDLVSVIRPDVYVKGADWNRPEGPRPPEASAVLGYGGRVAYVDLVPVRSTTAIIQTIVQRYQTTGEDASPS